MHPGTYHIIIFAAISTLIWSLRDLFFIILLLLSPIIIGIIRSNLGVGNFVMMTVVYGYLGIAVGYCLVFLRMESLRLKRKRGG